MVGETISSARKSMLERFPVKKQRGERFGLRSPLAHLGNMRLRTQHRAFGSPDAAFEPSSRAGGTVA